MAESNAQDGSTHQNEAASATTPGGSTSDQSFQRRYRLTRGADFRSVFQRPQVSQDRYFRILHRAVDGPEVRLGMAVSARSVRRAVDRNRLKRLVRESFRHARAGLALGGGRDIVVLPRPLAASICNSELRASLADHWRRIGRAGPSATPQRRKQ